jgi:putative aminopeptidase FrvX
MNIPTPSEAHRAEHLRWLLELTSIPTAAGKESRVIAWVRDWAAQRAGVEVIEDRAGNLVLRRRAGAGSSVNGSGAGQRPPVLFTAHLDHPAFVVERIIGPGTVELSFRGGVMEPYFVNGKVRIVTGDGGGAEPRSSLSPALSHPPVGERRSEVRAVIVESRKAEPFKMCVAELESAKNDGGGGADDESPECPVRVGDVAVWDLPDAFVRDGLAHTPACDDLAALAAALAAFDVLLAHERAAHVQILLTRAEEIGFVGAIAASRDGTIPAGARVIALENSRSFPLDSPIGAGPIVRVGDRLSTFSPALTAAVSKVAELLAEQRKDSGEPFRWQRKLMAGGACEATTYQCYGFDATCVCLPLGNYHNMADLERVQAGDAAAVASATIAPEFISVADYHGLIDLLIGCGVSLESVEPIRDRMEKLYEKLGFVLRE